jgi:hypothetical protein
LKRYSLLILPLFMFCRTYVDIQPPAKGSVENPVLCDQPEGQRRYLRLMRGPDGSPVKFEYLDAVQGPGGHILDRFKVENPARKTDKRSMFSQLWDYIASDPEVPVYFRIYMDLYNPGKLDTEAVPGYKVGAE